MDIPFLSEGTYRMSLSRVRALNRLRHPDLALRRRDLDHLLERLVERYRVRHRRRVAPRAHHVAQVVHGHARPDNHDALVPQRRNRPS